MQKYLFALGLVVLCAAPAQAMRVAPGKIVACTMEAMVCPDGSSVSRTGPNCTFAPCPGTTTGDNGGGDNDNNGGDGNDDRSVAAPPVTPQPPQMACPMFRRLCPDGSSVGPTGPNCQVPACPGEGGTVSPGQPGGVDGQPPQELQPQQGGGMPGEPPVGRPIPPGSTEGQSGGNDGGGDWDNTTQQNSGGGDVNSDPFNKETPPSDQQ